MIKAYVWYKSYMTVIKGKDIEELYAICDNFGLDFIALAWEGE